MFTNNLFIQFIIINIINVIIQTIKSLTTQKCGKLIAAITNAIAYGFYTIVVVYMVGDLQLWLKVITVGSCNFVGVFIVKWGEEILRKDKLWKVEATVATDVTQELDELLSKIKIPCSYIELSNKHTVFNIYCATQKESATVKELIDRYNAKYFVSESKNLY